MARNKPLIRKKDFIGKTIQNMDVRAVNVVVFTFTDGTRVELEVEGLGNGIAGIVQCDCQSG